MPWFASVFFGRFGQVSYNYTNEIGLMHTHFIPKINMNNQKNTSNYKMPKHFICIYIYMCVFVFIIQINILKKKKCII